MTILTIPTFYQNKDFVFEHNRVVRRTLNRSNVVLSERAPDLRDTVISYFDWTSFERAGVLHGEYMLDYLGIGLARRDGVAFKINVSWEDSWASQLSETQYRSPEFAFIKNSYKEYWNNTPVVENPLIISHPYGGNYFHFTTELMPKMRFFSPVRSRNLILPEKITRSPSQIDLITCFGNGRFLFSIDRPVRVRNPMLVEESMSEEGIYWLNQNFNSNFKKGSRNIYIRRGSTGTRMGGGGDLVQNSELESFLKDHNFEIITFGNGELSVRQQVGLLDGANIILCTHGAALTNIVYLKPPVSILEVISPMTPRACFMHIASTLGFKYYGLFNTNVDPENNILVGRDELEEAMSVLAKG